MSDFSFKIESGIEPPKDRQRLIHKFPFDKMKPGQSFFVPEETLNVDSVRQRVAYANRKYRESEDEAENVLKFSVRKVEGGCRVWRMEPIAPKETSAASKNARKGSKSSAKKQGKKDEA